MTTRNIIFLLLAGLGVLFIGCGSDSVAPQDEAPPLQPQGAAAQAGYMARMVTEIAPTVFDLPGKDVGEASYTFIPPSDISGIVLLSFRTGGPTGTPCDDDVADFCFGRTAAGAPLQLAVGEDTHVIYELEFELNATINQAENTTLVNSNKPGIFRAGTYQATWTIQDLLVDADDWPADGLVIFTVMGYECEVEFNNTSTASITVAGETFHVNLATCVIVE